MLSFAAGIQMVLGSTIATLLIAGGLILLNEKIDLFSCDRFPSVAHKMGAYTLLVVLVFVISAMVISSSAAVDDLIADDVSFLGLFVFHALMVAFLVAWWFLTSRPNPAEFLNVSPVNLGEASLLGVGVGVGGWVVTIAVALAAGLIVMTLGVSPEDLQPSPMIPWIAGLVWWKKSLIVVSAMTVEEAFYRGWLQKRIGLVASTVIFAVSHAGYGQPFMLIGVTTISFVIGFAFYKTRNLVPCIIAHGVFDAIQIFVVVPVALKFAPLA